MFWDIPYKGLNLGCFPSSSIILWSYDRCSGSLSASFYKNTSRRLWYFTGTFIAGLVCFFGAKAFSISAIVTAKIVCLGFLASCASGVALIMWISRALSGLWLSVVSYVVPCLILGSVLGTELVLDLGSGSLSMLFIVEY